MKLVLFLLIVSKSRLKYLEFSYEKFKLNLNGMKNAWQLNYYKFKF
jgi:hypothetical protein